MRRAGFAVLPAVLFTMLMSCVSHPGSPDRRLTRNAVREAEAAFNRGMVYHHRGDFHRAITEYTRALATLPAFIPALGSRAEVYVLTESWDLAIADLMALLLIEPENPFAIELLSIAEAMAAGHPEEE